MAPTSSRTAKLDETYFTVGRHVTANARCARPTEPDEFEVIHEIYGAEDVFALGRDVMHAMNVHRFQMGAILDSVQDGGLLGPYASFDELCLTEYGLNSSEADALINIYRTLARGGVRWRDVKKLCGWQQRMFREIAASGVLNPDDFGAFMKTAGKTNSAKPVAKPNSR